MSKKVSVAPLTILILIVIGLWLISGVIIIKYLPTWSDRGTFGDLFGTVNALFSGLAFAGLIYTIYLQRKELDNTNKEVEITKKEQYEQLKLITLNSKLSAYSTILNPQAGFKNRTIGEHDLNEDTIKAKFLKTLLEIENIENDIRESNNEKR